MSTNTRIYFDNAATTDIDPIVAEAMIPLIKDGFGNPSSIYSYGREIKSVLEGARKSVAQLLGANPGEIFFTSGGTESANMILRRAVYDLGVKHIISSPIEHHCVTHTVDDIDRLGHAKAHWVALLEDGSIDLTDLEEKLKSLKGEKTIVSLMHANNEIGNLLDIEKVGALVHSYDALFHSDTVQTIAHYKFNLKEMPVDFITGSGHKFHGPKGTGIVYISDKVKIHPFITGGGQERNMRAGTENVYGIAGFAKAMEIAYANFETEKAHISAVKEYMREQLKQNFPDISFNGNQGEWSLYTVLSTAFPKNEKTEMLLYTLDMAGICVSGGSACSSGASAGSHVIQALYKGQANQSTIRFSFSKNNTKEQVDIVINKLKELLA
ncbi:MAG: hypothetical protein RL138_1172 [Bacteroidota bacterium]|jgi:cysteine desulfurase